MPSSKSTQSAAPGNSKQEKPLKVALIHDYLREYGGAERVLEVLHQMYPQAPVYVAFQDRQALGMHAARFEGWDIRESWMTRVPFYKRWFSPLRLFSPQYFSKFDLSAYDLIISSTNAYFAKAITKPVGAIHLCYCHTPARSLYGYTTMSDWQKNPITRIVGTLINHYLRVVDFQVAQKVDHFIANSEETAQRIKKFYRRDSTVIYPPVQLPAETTGDAAPRSATTKVDQGYYLYVNRLALAKHPELAVQAATQLKVPLKVVGTGKMLAGLKAMAGPTVEFLESVDDQQLHQLYAGATALLYPVEDEDFGMVPIEAMGHGVPVIAHLSGGPRETIIEEKTGLFIHELSVAALVEAMLLLKTYTFKPQVIQKHAQQFSVAAFEQRLRRLIGQTAS